MSSIIKKIKKFYRNSDLFIYDMFRKRLEKKQLKINATITNNNNFNLVAIERHLDLVNKRIR